MALPIIPGEVRYLLEVYRGDQLTRSITCPLVTTYQVAWQPAIDFEYTLTDDPIRDHDGYREVVVSITGTSGFGYRLGEDASGGPLFANGWDLFQEFRQFIADYLSECKDAQQSARLAPQWSTGIQGGVPVLVFRALAEGDAFKVEPMRFDPHRGEADHNFTWGYPLQLRGYGAPSERPLNVIERFFASAQSAAETATRFIDQATAYVALADRYVSGFQATRASFLGPVRAVGRLMDQVGRLASGAVGLAGPPTDLVRSIIDVADEATQALQDTIDALPYGDRSSYRTDYYDAMSAIEESRRTAIQVMGQRRAKLGAATSAPLGHAGPDSTPSAGPSVVTAYTVGAGESLASIAVKVLGDVSRMAEIAEINQMSDPRTLNDGSPLGAGATLLVPNAAGVDSAIVGAGAQADTYGTDVLMVNGDWVSTGDDVLLVSGVANFGQALDTRFRTVQGDWRARPGVGMPKTVGETSGPRTAGLVSSHMRSQALRDPRVKGVRDVRVKVDGDTVIAEADIQARVDGGVATVGVPVAAA